MKITAMVFLGMLVFATNHALASQDAANPASTAKTAATSTSAATDSQPPVIDDFPIRIRNGYLVDNKGRGLYTYDGDKVAGRSDCDAMCIVLWPPYRVREGDKPRKDFSIIRRSDDGTRQWAYRGKPLYRWVSDKKRGDMGGEGIAGVWRLVKVSQPKTVTGASEKAIPDKSIQQK